MATLFQKFLQRVVGYEQPKVKAPQPIIPFTPRATYMLEEPSEMDVAQQIETYRYSWVYACASKISSEVAKLDLKLMRKKGDEIEEVKEHEMLDLLDKVNSFMTRYDLFEHLGLFLELAGEEFWWKIRNKQGKVISLYPWFAPQNMKVVPGSDTFVKGYVYKVPGSSQELTFEPEDIIHFKYPNPQNPYRGLSPVKAAEYAIASDRESSKWNWRFFKNAAKPFGIIQLKEGTLTDEQYRRAKSQWEAGHSGQDQHKIAILEGGAEFKEIGYSQKDMDFLEQRKFGRDEIFTIFKVPKSLFVGEDANRAIAETQKSVFIEETIMPKYQKIVSYLNEFLLSEYEDDSLFLSFNNFAPRNLEADLKFYESGIANGWLSPNEVRALEGFDPYENGDTVYIPFNFQAAGTVKMVSKHARLQFKTKLGSSVREKVMREVLADEKNQELFKKIAEGHHAKQIESKPKKETEIEEKPKAVQYSKEFKELYWKRLISMTDIEEDKVVTLLQSEFKRQEENVSRSVRRKAKKPFTFDFDVDEETALMRVSFRSIIQSIILNHGQDIMEFLGDARGFVDSEQAVQVWIKSEGLKFVKQINQTTMERLQQAIAEGVAEGEGVEKIRRRVQATFENASTTRARVIARTETARAANFGIQAAYDQSDFVTGKEWITALDERVDSELCAPMDGQIVAKDDAWILPDGTRADVPQDSHPNCRCSSIPVIPLKGYDFSGHAIIDSFIENANKKALIRNEKINAELEKVIEEVKGEVKGAKEVTEKLVREIAEKEMTEIKKKIDNALDEEDTKIT